MENEKTAKINHRKKDLLLLQEWALLNLYYPYPSRKQKHQFLVSTRLSKKQVHNWFVNYRIRIWPKKLAIATGLSQGKVKVFMEILREKQRHNIRLSRHEVQKLIADLHQGMNESVVSTTGARFSTKHNNVGSADMSSKEPNSCLQQMSRSSEKFSQENANTTYQTKLPLKHAQTAMDAPEHSCKAPKSITAQLQPDLGIFCNLGSDSKLVQDSKLVPDTKLFQVHHSGSRKNSDGGKSIGLQNLCSGMNIQPTFFAKECPRVAPCSIHVGEFSNTFPHVSLLECVPFSSHQALESAPLDGIIRDINPLEVKLRSMDVLEDENERLIRQKLEWLGENLDEEMIGATTHFGGYVLPESYSCVFL
uniref:Homeobox domain-containing protein n=1 Tax=Fibrocapsa japonica TaxID=94617 RepID=A0A7S2V3W7_9STRA|mmetsp:Transcript_6036/g.9142  ORF Transcript_6036/g.9142 Transcript_6036/m.9142 type:complete len:363 (+) Transcript_6036:89-1177(+)|eukprot:CAMPEP_0113939370 /NCGR_PEP_ID=MMETSP1339-20121228/5702_1 /TAXON_ID=94617 /ORGANISM="Fibrocapsa japonica" /LENGTH=362 /DNA_ID=CAMNT_0000942861 /DNA_START=30 /DNA_END=1118 /DNA_ORIENTATION=+ /assembly_acc=CAM_ASM_000762